ncbi:hypothetical protein B9Z55_007197 [Caenorhabditis nigoni]|uniref:HTH CENPB-type domain-containing protein n=1 Tax=Caenorhabditis nigoni TaxID=1611254 RepID=A0A2G5V8M0_9PELO|nr:hypothetical protein B9Z55_007197 [Caenorhabditis nigoni]
MSALLLWQAVHEVLTNSPKKVQLDRKQSATVQHLVNILRQWEEEELEVEESVVVDRIEDEEEDPDYDPLINSSAQYAIPTDPDNPAMCRIGDQLVDVDQVQQAVDYYGSFGDADRKGKARPSWNTVNKKFPFIKKEQHLRKLAEFERNGLSINLHNAIKWVSRKLYEKVEHHLEQGHILHDRDLRSMAMEIVTMNNLDIRFKASDSWIFKFSKIF